VWYNVTKEEKMKRQAGMINKERRSGKLQRASRFSSLASRFPISREGNMKRIEKELKALEGRFRGLIGLARCEEDLRSLEEMKAALARLESERHNTEWAVIKAAKKPLKATGITAGRDYRIGKRVGSGTNVSTGISDVQYEVTIGGHRLQAIAFSNKKIEFYEQDGDDANEVKVEKKLASRIWAELVAR